ncbi:MAG: SLOG domain-containing protein [Candidatus Nanopelagicales bacterium]
MSRIFLSASFPSGSRGDAVSPYRPADIAAATSSAVEAVLRTGSTLAFGGHPTISPIVLHVAGLLGAGPQVEIWQSAWFSDSITDEVHRLVGQERARLFMTEASDDLDGSLVALREAMLASEVRAAFFIGGMEGILAEYELVMDRHPRAMVFLFEAPGGMSALLASNASVLGPRAEIDGLTDTDTWSVDGPQTATRRLPGRAYGSSAIAALASVGLHIQSGPGET